MITLCLMFAIGVIALFTWIMMVAVATLGICLKTIGASGLMVIAIVWISVWCYRTIRTLAKKS